MYLCSSRAVALAATKATGIWEGIAYNADGLSDLDYEPAWS